MWNLAVIAECALLLAFICRRASFTWPALGMFLSVACLRDVMGWWAYACDFPHLYWWNYYAGDLVIAVFKLRLMIEIGIKLSGGMPFVVRHLGRNVWGLATTTAWLAGLMAIFHKLRDHVPFYDALAFYCRRIDFCLAIACVVTLFAVYGLAIAFRFQFSHGVRPVAVGFLVEVTSTYLVSFLSAIDIARMKLFISANSISYLLVVLCFSSVLFPTRRMSPRSAQIPPKEIRAHVA